jgi:hypothetical protein
MKNFYFCSFFHFSLFSQTMTLEDEEEKKLANSIFMQSDIIAQLSSAFSSRQN